MTGETLTPLLVILGPTAVGKTALAITLAQALNGEIISADSRQIYIGMDIGTAKPTADQRAAVPHHLIDIVQPDEQLTAAEFQQMAYAKIADIRGRGRLAMLVGGTGQYITAILEGWSIPKVAPDMALRAELEKEVEQFGVQALHDRLCAVDPEAADAIHVNNVRRVIRALEVYQITGTPISVLQRKQPPPYRVWQIGLTMDRDTLYAQADRRVDEMMQARFLDEVRGLLDDGYSRHLPSMSGIGYAQLTEHLLDGVPLEEAIRRTYTATHDFIRRQYTWFRGHDAGIHWMQRDHVNTVDLIGTISEWLAQGESTNS